MKPEDVVSCVTRKYAACATYLDSGTVVCIDQGSPSFQLEFKTAFVKPDYFLFQWQNYPGLWQREFSTLWSNEGRVCVRFPWGFEHSEDLALAIAGAHGCSAGSASMIPMLFLTHLPQHQTNMLQLRNLSMGQMEDCEGERCYVILGSRYNSNDVIFWISTKSFVIRRIRFERISGRSASESMEATEQDEYISDYFYKAVAFNSPVDKVACPSAETEQ